MTNWTPRIVIIVLLAGIVLLPVVFRPVEAEVDGDAQRLIVITPHNEQIRREIELAFNLWHQQQFDGESVVIDWRSLGTSDIERILFNQYRKAAQAGRDEQGVGYDVVFGGGDYMFDKKLKAGFEITDDHGAARQVSITQPIELPPLMIQQVFGENAVGGERIYDPDGHWWGVVLSSFGIAYNQHVLEKLDLDEPTTWTDMARPGLAGWIALADPSHSGSVRVTYEAILRYGTNPPETYLDDTTGRQRFVDGTATLRRIFANARYFSPSSTKIPLDVSAGEAAMGICIDYYGRFQSQVVGDGRRVGFVAPANQTKISADPVAVLRGAPNRELAIRFVRFLLTMPGQAIWNFPLRPEPGTFATEDPATWGPARFELHRAPVHRELYHPELFGMMVDRVDPYAIARPVPDGTPYYFSELPTYLHAMCMDVHDDLKAAWAAINRTEDTRLKQRMLAEFDKLPFTFEEFTNVRRSRWKVKPGSEDEDRLAWTLFFRDQYRKVVDMAE